MRALHFATVALTTAAALAQPIPVRHVEGAKRGFLLIRSESGSILGHGQVSQLTQGDRVTLRTTLHFLDGSLDDETSVYTQRKSFQFVSDHHIQRGPFFKNALDFTINASGDVTLHTAAPDGKDKTETNHLDLPPTLSNGLLGTLLLNIAPHTAETDIPMLLPSGKGRLVKLVVTPDGTQSFSPVAGDHRLAQLFRIHIDLGGLTGAVAPIVGKQPSDLTAWVVEDQAPVLVRETGQLSEGGPMVSIELAGTNFPRSTQP